MTYSSRVFRSHQKALFLRWVLDSWNSSRPTKGSCNWGIYSNALRFIKLWMLVELNLYLSNFTNPRMHLFHIHNAQPRTEMCTFLFWMEHCGILNRCILGLRDYELNLNFEFDDRFWRGLLSQCTRARAKQEVKSRGRKAEGFDVLFAQTRGPFHAFLPLLRHVVPINDGNYHLTIPIFKGRCAREALPHAFNIGMLR